MQIRIGNRQDEAGIRKLAAAELAEHSVDLDLSGKDSDLRNIEGNYIGRNGTFVVAEIDRDVVAFAGAAALNDTTLEFKRLLVAPSARGRGIGKQLLAQVLKFARDLDYHRIEVSSALEYPSAQSFLLACGFLSSAENPEKLHLDLT